MTSLTANLDRIMAFAGRYQLPLANRQAILREYLQSRILEFIYSQKSTAKLFFVGGTALRLLYSLDRFSEDMDFNLVDLSAEQLTQLMSGLKQRLAKENLPVKLYHNRTKKKLYFELRFAELLYELGISSHKEANLVIKFDFESFWQGQTASVVSFERFGFFSQVVTPNMNQLLVQKLYAYLHRKQTLARDIYDLVWLYAQGARLDQQFIQANRLPVNMIEQAQTKFQADKLELETLKQKLKPFLIYPENVRKLELFEVVLEKLEKKSISSA